MSFGLPASASRFSVRSLNDLALVDDQPVGERRAQRSQRPLDERRLQLELFEVLGLHRPKLREPGLDGVDRARCAQRVHDQRHGAAGGEREGA